MKKITVQMLRDRKACANALANFQERFGEEADASAETLREMNLHAMSWAVDELLTEEQREEYWKGYDRTTHSYGLSWFDCPACGANRKLLEEIYNAE